jgi:uncharacterized protein
MKLTDSERLMLLRMHEILAHLVPTDAKRHELNMRILSDGYHEREYDPHLSAPISAADGELVYDVLDLYRSLNTSYKALPPKDRKGVDKSDLAFKGFDLNHEIDLYGYTQFLIQEAGKWAELKQAASFNSHTGMREYYNRMLEKARALGAHRTDYTAQEINDILSA